YTRTRTWPGPGSGSGASRSSSTSGPPAAVMTTARMRDNVSDPGPRCNVRLPEEEQADGRDQEDREEHQDVQNRHAAGEARGPVHAAAPIEGIFDRPPRGLSGADDAFVQTALRAVKW